MNKFKLKYNISIIVEYIVDQLIISINKHSVFNGKSKNLLIITQGADKVNCKLLNLKNKIKKLAIEFSKYIISFNINQGPAC